MADGDDRSGKGIVTAKTATPTSISLGPKATLDISWLPEEERRSLLADYARGVLDVNRKAMDYQVDVETLQNALRVTAAAVKDAAEGGSSATISHTQTTSIGRTEVLMGNTEQASSGKLTKSQTGEHDWTPLYVIGGLIAAVLIAAVIGQ